MKLTAVKTPKPSVSHTPSPLAEVGEGVYHIVNSLGKCIDSGIRLIVIRNTIGQRACLWLHLADRRLEPWAGQEAQFVLPADETISLELVEK